MHILPSVLELRCEPIPLVRIGLIGLGQRGMKTLERYAFIKDAEIRYVVDLSEEKTTEANEKLLASGRPLAKTLIGQNAWMNLCLAEDVDLIYICTKQRR